MPFRFFVFSTMIYDLLVTRVPRYDAATALAVRDPGRHAPAGAGPAVADARPALHHRHRPVPEPRRTRSAAGGGPRSPWCWSCSSSCWASRWSFALLGTFMKLFGFFDIPRAVDARQLDDGPGRRAVPALARQHAVLAIGTAVAAILVHSLIAYIVVRTRYAGRRAARPRLVAALHRARHHPGPGPAVAVPRTRRCCGRSTAPPPC